MSVWRVDPGLDGIVASLWFGEGKALLDRDARGREGAESGDNNKGGVMPEVNWLAIIVAAVGSFILGGLWYSRLLFGKAWQREAGVTDEQLANGNAAKILGLALLLCLLASWMFATFLGPRPSMALGFGAGFAAGLFWVTASFGINYLFERKSLKLFLINGGYHTLQFTLIGGVISLLSA